MRKIQFFVYQVLFLFSFLGVLFVPFQFEYLSFQTKITTFIFEDLIVNIASVFEFIKIKNPEITSDSTSFYVLFVVLFLWALIIAIILFYIPFYKKNQLLFLKIIQLILTYYLAVMMLKYGFCKIFKTQFYLPEPNILYSRVGMLDKDILFWTTMGASYSYNIFMGLLEVVPALFLLFSRTRILGLLLLLGVLIQVVSVNFCFDISVKLYSLFLLFICFLLVLPFLKQLVQFFVLQKTTVLSRFSGQDLVASKLIRWGLKSVLIGCFFIEILSPYLLTKQFNDDAVPRNDLHGAYSVFKIEKTIKNTQKLDLKRIFIHRQNYFIIQHLDESFDDFSLEINAQKHQLVLTDYDGEKIVFSYKYSPVSRVLELRSAALGLVIYSKSLPWQDLPLLQPLFHWTVDAV